MHHVTRDNLHYGNFNLVPASSLLEPAMDDLEYWFPSSRVNNNEGCSNVASTTEISYVASNTEIWRKIFSFRCINEICLIHKI